MHMLSCAMEEKKSHLGHAASVCVCVCVCVLQKRSFAAMRTILVGVHDV